MEIVYFSWYWTITNFGVFLIPSHQVVSASVAYKSSAIQNTPVGLHMFLKFCVKLYWTSLGVSKHARIFRRF
jgi:hypothetical protein